MIWLLTLLAVATAPPADAATVNRLARVGELAGLVRHFHPSDEAAEADWDAVTAEMMRRALAAEEPAELEQAVRDVLLPLAPTLRINLDGPAMRPAGDGLQVVTWQHVGPPANRPPTIYRSFRVYDDPPDGPLPEATVALADDLTVAVPLRAWAVRKRTVPPGGEPAIGRADERATWLAAVVSVHDLARHFWPYRDELAAADWDATYRRALAEMLRADDRAAATAALRRQIAALGDGHGFVVDPAEALAALPVNWRIIDGELVVTATADNRVNVGDVVTKIDGEPAADAVARQRELESASTLGFSNHRTAFALLRRPPDTVVRLTLARGPVVDVTAARPLPPEAAKLPPIHELRPGVVYADLDRLDLPTFNANLRRLHEADAVIYDLRGYPRQVMVPVLGRLAREPARTAPFLVARTTLPDFADPAWQDGGWAVPPMDPPTAGGDAGRVIFLTDGRAVSAAETLLGVVKAHGLARMVGSPTAGTNGNVSAHDLPGGWRFVFTGMKVTKHDGTPLMGVGILPDIEVRPTAAGVAAGRDEVLEAALDLLAEPAGVR